MERQTQNSTASHHKIHGGDARLATWDGLMDSHEEFLELCAVFGLWKPHRRRTKEAGGALTDPRIFNMKGAETESATQSAAGSKSGEGDVSIRTLEDLLRRYPIMRYHTRPWTAWPSSAHRCSEAKNSL